MNIYYKGVYMPAERVVQLKARDKALAAKQVEDAKKEDIKEEEKNVPEVKEEEVLEVEKIEEVIEANEEAKEETGFDKEAAVKALQAAGAPANMNRKEETIKAHMEKHGITL